jgi:hypothetical protein
VQRVKVLYLLAVYRSGSTITSNLIGQLEGFCCVGELRALWRQLDVPDARCGCGALLPKCPLWSEVLSEAFGSVDEARALAGTLRHDQAQVLRWSHTWLKVPSLLRRSEPIGASDDGPLKRLGSALEHIYLAIRQVSGAEVIVDSSKEATDASLLRLLGSVDPYFVQVVRDPRGVVYSATKARNGSPARPTAQALESAYGAMSWLMGNVAQEMLRKRVGRARSMLVRYEDFADQPYKVLSSMTEFVGKPTDTSRAEGLDQLTPTHTVDGNPNRFRTGQVSIAPDLAWQSQLGAANSAVIAACASPLLARYGYPLSSRKAPRPKP